MKEALTLALEALELALSDDQPYIVKCGEAITAIKEALAQPDAFEQGRQEGVKQERALWELSRLGQEIEAQPEQAEALNIFEYWNAVEGWVKIDEVRKHFGSVGCGTIYKTAGEDRVPLYTTPPQRPWVGLTQQDIDIAFDDTQEGGGFDDFARAIEAKLKEKNT